MTDYPFVSNQPNNITHRQRPNNRPTTTVDNSNTVNTSYKGHLLFPCSYFTSRGMRLVVIAWLLFSFIYIIRYSRELSLIYNDTTTTTHEYVTSHEKRAVYVNASSNDSSGGTMTWPHRLLRHAEEFIRSHVQPTTTTTTTTTTTSANHSRLNWEDIFNRIEAEDVSGHGGGVAVSELYCNMTRKMLWEEYIPTLEPALQRALHYQRRLHEAVAEGRLIMKRIESDDVDGDVSSRKSDVLSFEIKSKPGDNEPPIIGPVKVLVWSLSGGLGNRIQSIVSTLIAAMLSHRIILMKDWFTPLPNNKMGAKSVIYPSQRTNDYVLEPLMKLFASTVLKPKPSGVGSSVLVDPRKDDEWAPNRMLLCPFLPIMSLRDFKRKYPEYFSSDRKEQYTNTNTSKHTVPSPGGGSLVEVASAREDHIKVDIGASHDKRLVRWPRFLCADLLSDNHKSSTNHNSHRLKNRKKNPDTFVVGALSPTNITLYNHTSSAPPPLPFFSETFVYIWTNQYYLPAFFANPYSHEVMMKWFPDPLRAYNIISKLVALPSLHVMRRVVNMFGRLPPYSGAGDVRTGKGSSETPYTSSGVVDNPMRRGTASFLVPGEYNAIQVRAFRINALLSMSEAFDACIVNLIKGTDFSVQQKKEKTNDSNNSNNINYQQIKEKSHQVPIFLATLYKPVFEYFMRKYGPSKVYNLVPPRSVQGTGKAFTHDIDALSDVIILSLGKTLFVSPGSTFGVLAAAIGDISSIRVNFNIPVSDNRLSSSSLLTDRNPAKQERCQVIPSLRPCFGSWYRYDKLVHMSRLKRISDISEHSSQRTVPSMSSCILYDIPEESCN